MRDEKYTAYVTARASALLSSLPKEEAADIAAAMLAKALGHKVTPRFVAVAVQSILIEERLQERERNT